MASFQLRAPLCAHQLRQESVLSRGAKLPARSSVLTRTQGIKSRVQASIAADEKESLLGRCRAAAVAAVAAAAICTASPASVQAIPQTSACATDACDDFDFSNRDLRKEFYTKGSLKRADFSGSNLERVTFFGANLEGAKFKGANLLYADIGQCNLEKADLTDAILEGVIVSSTRFNGATITGSDWTDVIIRKDINDELCRIASGTNPVTGVDTRDSLLCD